MKAGDFHTRWSPVNEAISYLASALEEIHQGARPSEHGEARRKIRHAIRALASRALRYKGPVKEPDPSLPNQHAAWRDAYFDAAVTSGFDTPVSRIETAPVSTLVPRRYLIEQTLYPSFDFYVALRSVCLVGPRWYVMVGAQPDPVPWLNPLEGYLTPEAAQEAWEAHYLELARRQAEEALAAETKLVLELAPDGLHYDEVQVRMDGSPVFEDKPFGWLSAPQMAKAREAYLLGEDCPELSRVIDELEIAASEQGCESDALMERFVERRLEELFKPKAPDGPTD